VRAVSCFTQQTETGFTNQIEQWIIVAGRIFDGSGGRL
jgi:hypothetical protein